jgi:hypothetical protein
MVSKRQRGKSKFNYATIPDPVSPGVEEMVSAAVEDAKGGLRCSPFGISFVSATVRGPRPPCRVNPQVYGGRKTKDVGGGVPDVPASP